MDLKSRVKAYGAQRGLSVTGAFKNKSATNKLTGKLTPAQRRRLRHKENSASV